MALRNQPYFPLYVQDYLTDEKLNMCSLSAQGLYIKILCLLHKQEVYGSILFHQKQEQNINKIDYFADYISKQIPVQKTEIQKLLTELVDEKVLIITDDMLYQKRMLNDGKISQIRSKIGKDGGGSRLNKQYGQKGILYFLSDKDTKHKIGVTTNLQQRVYQIRSKNKLSKLFNVVKYIEINDMGKTEDNIKEYFNNDIEGEWIKLSFNEALNKFNLFHQNYKQNPEYEYKDDNDIYKDIFLKYKNHILQQSVTERLAMNLMIKPNEIKHVINEFIETCYGEIMEKKNAFAVETYFINWVKSKENRVSDAINNQVKKQQYEKQHK